MKPYVNITILPAMLLAAVTLLEGATPQQARITLVERNAASSAQAGALPSVVRKQVPGEPDHEAYRFSQAVHVGSPVTEIVRVAFHQPTTLSSIVASNDFHVASSSCQMGRTYSEGDSCDVSVTLDPKGPGKRAGQLIFASNESATPDVVGLQGDTLGAVLSFIPAQISTVSQTMPGGKPLFNQAIALATDQGDNLYVVDASSPTGSGLVYFMDSSLQIAPMIGGGTQHLASNGAGLPSGNVYLSSPVGVAVDSFLDVYNVELFGGLDMTSRGSTRSIAGLGATPASNCISPCTGLNAQFASPLGVNVDDAQNIYVNDMNGYYNLPWTPTGKFNLAVVNSGNLARNQPFGLDAQDNLYALDVNAGTMQCMIDGITPMSDMQWDAAGSGICGTTGNNVRSQNAEMQNQVGQITFDAAGDMYFTDESNNLIRRVDSYNGLIRTVAGIPGATAGYGGDGGPATAARLDAPAGMAVDSMGDVYAAQTDPAVTTTTTNIVRKVGPAGYLQFPTMLVGKTSAVQTELLTNTGNDALLMTSVIWGGANPGDFAADPATSSCIWSAPLPSGRSCQLGYTCKPTAAGVRSATITFVDNTATFQNVLYLSCYAISAPVTTKVTIAEPANNAVFIAGSNVATYTTVSNSILSPVTPPTGTVNMVITNTGTSATTPYTGLPLSPTAASSSSFTKTQTFTKAPVGAYQITASYSGDTLDAAGTATPINFTVVQVTPTVTITIPANNSQYLPGPLTASITVSNAGMTPTAPTPTGTLTVTLTNTGTNAKSTFNPTLPAGSNGQATAMVPLGSLALGTYTISAAYSGDTADTAANSATNNFSVVQITPTVTITSPAATSYPYLTALTYSAKVSNAGLTPADPNAPTGTVTFTLTNLGTSAQTTYGPYTLGAGSANVVNISVPSTQTPTVASYSLTAKYNGDTDDAPATSSPLDFNVTPVTPTIFWATPNFIYTGTALSSTQLDAIAKYNGNVVPGNYVYNPPAGTVMNTAGEQPLNVTFYPTDNVDYNQAMGSVQIDVVQQVSALPKPTVTTLSGGKNPAAEGDILNFNATVRSESSAAPTGTVTLTENGKALVSGPVVNGTASLSVGFLPAGSHSLAAVYSGDAAHGASTSEILSLVVTPAPKRAGPTESQEN